MQADHADLQGRLNTNRTLLDQASAYADRQVFDIVASGNPVLDPIRGGYRMFGEGEYTLANGLSVAGGLLPGVLKAGGVLAGIGAAGEVAEGAATESAIARAARLGAEGEEAVGITGPKVGIYIPESGQLRFPDQVTTTTLTEVKNVGYQAYTQQLRDYSAFAQDEGLTFNLYVRGNTRISSNPFNAEHQGEVVIYRDLPIR